MPQQRTGTFSPEGALARLIEDPSDALFVHDGLDDGVTGRTRITEHATVRIEIPLPPDVILADDPARRSVILNRGTPTTLNTPALDPMLMYDTREPNLQSQAFNAIHGHAQNTREPTAVELDLIKEFQQTDPRFFSSEALRVFANGGPPPQLPAGTSESERRGRAMFDNVLFDGVTTRGLCNTCHSGPMLNRFAPGNSFGLPPGGRRASIGVSEQNLMGNPVYTFLVREPDGGTFTITTPDPGAMYEQSATERATGSANAASVVFRELLQDPGAMGRQGHGSVLPRQLRQDARGRREVLRHFLLQ